MCSIIIINIILRDLLHHRCGKVSFSPYSRHILTAKGGHASSSCHNFSYFAFRSNILLNIQANLEDVSSGRKGMKIWTYERAKDFKCKKILNNIHQNNDSQLALT